MVKEHASRIRKAGLFGAPDLVVEILSPSTEARDRAQKPEVYGRHGVREYWIVHPERKEVLVLRRVRGQWSEQTLTVADDYSPRLLPGFQLRVTEVVQHV